MMSDPQGPGLKAGKISFGSSLGPRLRFDTFNSLAQCIQMFLVSLERNPRMGQFDFFFFLSVACLRASQEKNIALALFLLLLYPDNPCSPPLFSEARVKRKMSS